MFRVKICGITKPDDARLVVAAGADAIGINFYAGSKRFVAPEIAQEIAAAVGNRALKVGVFVNSTAAEILKLAAETPLDYVQLHGDETPEFVADLSDLPTIKALRIRDASLAPVVNFLAACESAKNLRGILLDAYSSTEFGGTGQTLDWENIGRAADRPAELPIVLAGGLTPDNVDSAVRLARPDAVDTASGVESAPGVKDKRKVEAFVKNAFSE